MKLGQTLIDFAQLMQLNPEFSVACKKFGQNFQSLSKLRNQIHQVSEEYLKTTTQLKKEDTEVGKLKQKYDAYKAQYMDFNLVLPPFGDAVEMASAPTPESIERLDAEAKKEYLAKVERTQNFFFQLSNNLNQSYSNLYNELDFQIRKRDIVYWEQLKALMYAYSCYFETGLMLSKQLETLCKPKQNDDDESSNAIIRKIDGTAGLMEGFGNVALGTRGVDKKLSRVNAKRKVVELPHSVFPDVIGKNKLFGAKLETIMVTDPQTGRRTIPSSIQQLFDFMYQFGIKTEGIFRIPGDNLYMENLKVVLEKNEIIPVMTHKAHFIHSIAGVLKLFIRDLAEPLMTHAAFDVIIPIANPSLKKQDEEIAEEIRKFILKTVPSDNVEFMYQLCKLLGTICDSSDINKMHATNLGLIMGMSFFKPKGDDPLKIASNVQNMSRITTIIISQYRTILKHKIDEENGAVETSEHQIETTEEVTTTSNNIKESTSSLEQEETYNTVDSDEDSITVKLNVTTADVHTVESDEEDYDGLETDIPMIVTNQRSLPENIPKIKPLSNNFVPPMINFNAPSAHLQVQQNNSVGSSDEDDNSFDMSQLNGVLSNDLIQSLSNTSSRTRGSVSKGSRNFHVQ